ncbi:MAG: methyltransferase domain-containing protein [Spirochaetes bacterium]|nr:methyltransferase domain-containing protein [Spirochaetota bacterium]
MNDTTGSKTAYFNGMGLNWDRISGNYGERLSLLKRAFDLIELRENDTVLDVGCGNGILFKNILKRTGPGGRLTALDSSCTMLARAKEIHAEYGNIDYINKPVEQADFGDGSFDAILCFAVFPHIDDKNRALHLFSRILKKPGRLYIFHLSDTDSLNRFHCSLDAPVNKDIMPGKEEFRAMLSGTSLKMIKYIDQEDLNFIECELC